MTRALLRAAALAVGLATCPAAAADLGVVPAYGAFSWTGFYVGANLGYAWGSISNTNLNHSGFAGGVQAGYNWQTQNIVFGAETDLQLTSASD